MLTAMYFYGVIKAVILPVAAAVTLPLSYTKPKPFWILWWVGLAIAILNTLGMAAIITIFSAMAGMTGNSADVTKSFSFMVFRLGGLLTVAAELSPFIVTYFLHKSSGNWSGNFTKRYVETIVVFLFVMSFPLAFWGLTYLQFTTLKHAI
jgi:hypothetical protein